MTISIDKLEERIDGIKEDVQEFKKKEADEGKRFNGLAKELFDKSGYNLKSINEVSARCEKEMADFKLKVEQKISKINIKIVMLSFASGGGAGYLTKLLGS